VSGRLPRAVPAQLEFVLGFSNPLSRQLPVIIGGDRIGLQLIALTGGREFSATIAAKFGSRQEHAMADGSVNVVDIGPSSTSVVGCTMQAGTPGNVVTCVCASRVDVRGTVL
jgi:hypothetical protein